MDRLLIRITMILASLAILLSLDNIITMPTAQDIAKEVRKAQLTAEIQAEHVKLIHDKPVVSTGSLDYYHDMAQAHVCQRYMTTEAPCTNNDLYSFMDRK